MGKLYLVPTPIGNLADMTFRAVETLQQVDLIAAEDTRHTGRLLQQFQITTPQISFHQHNCQQRLPHLLAHLQASKSLALVTDAGMPGIADPGHELIAACIAANITVIPLPGANAALTALIASGLATTRFAFEGFLPAKPKHRQELLHRLQAEPRTLIFYESPHRFYDTLQDFQACWGGERQIVVARELTKLYEEFWRGPINQALEHFQAHPAKGELTLIVSGTPEQPQAISDHAIQAMLQDLFNQGISPAQASRECAQMLQVSRRHVYALALELSGQK